ncbi:hypothetical protein BDF14DRAFT_1763392 [Spinellus fusiger]|nr:hypothetical protein BDF14DRAFT_1763392 [Spinellus fusiger]
MYYLVLHCSCVHFVPEHIKVFFKHIILLILADKEKSTHTHTYIYTNKSIDAQVDGSTSG